jgi:hypothetical protein
MIGKPYLNPKILTSVASKLRPFFDEQIQPHLSDVNGSLLSIEQHLEEISRSLNRIAYEMETRRRTEDLMKELKKEWG